LHRFIWLLCTSFYSCQKGEQWYNPERKIKRIYFESPHVYKCLSAEWTWNANKLEKIDYFDFYNGSIYNTERYFYEDNQLIKVEDKDGYFQISYKNAKYKKIEYYWNKDNSLIAVWEFSYKNGKVSKISFWADYIDFWVNKVSNTGFINSFITKEMRYTVDNSVNKSPKSLSHEMEITFSYKYKGDNIEEMIYEEEYEEDEFVTVTHQYKSYDNMLNPYYKYLGLMNVAPRLFLMKMVTSKNNPSEIVKHSSRAYWGYEKIRYRYKYDENYPIEEEETIILVYESGPNVIVGQSTIYYEYE
jgi:hypothetical protein